MTDSEAAVLHAEVAALQAVLISVLRRVSADQPDLTRLLCAAFDEAEAVLTGLAVTPGGSHSQVTSVNALRVVEEIRAGVLRTSGDCS